MEPVEVTTEETQSEQQVAVDDAIEAFSQSFWDGIVVSLIAVCLLISLSVGDAVFSVAFTLLLQAMLFVHLRISGAKLVALLLGLCLLPASSQAGNCNQFFYQQPVVAVPVAVAAPVYYQAGRDIEAEAWAEKVARLVEPRVIEKLGGETFKAELAAKRSQVKAEIDKTAPKSAVAEHCAKCHSGSAPKGGIVLDGNTAITGEQLADSLTAISDDSMPKDHKVSPDTKGNLMAELLALEKRGRIKLE